jgi:hypothetical protein
MKMRKSTGSPITEIIGNNFLLCRHQKTKKNDICKVAINDGSADCASFFAL